MERPPVSASPPKLLDCVRDAIRARHYSRRTEVAYVTWIRRYILFHHKVHPITLGAADISAFLTWLATKQHVSASTQNQALAALLFLYERVLQVPVGHVEHVVRARQPLRLPVVLSREEVTSVLSHLEGTMCIIGLLLYGAGLRWRDSRQAGGYHRMQLEPDRAAKQSTSAIFRLCYHPRISGLSPVREVFVRRY